MKRRRQAPSSIHVLEFGLRWPPETFLAAKLERLAARGVRITVACPDSRPRSRHAIDGVRVEPVVPTGQTSPTHLLIALLRLAVARPGRVRAVVRAASDPTPAGRKVGVRQALGRLRAYALLASLRPGIVHFEWNTAAVHFQSLVDALDCPSVVSVRGGDLEVHPLAPATMTLAGGYPAVFRRAAAVHCVSDAAKETALTHGLHPAKARVIRPAVDPSHFQPRAEERCADGTFRVVAVGWMHWRKGWEYALRAVARLVAEDVPILFDLVGPEPAPDMVAASDADRIRHAIDDLGLESRVRFHGPLEHGDVRALLEEADAFLHSSLAEGIPNVVLEAMACGLPVVVTDVGGTREVVTDGVEGYLVAPRDWRAAADALAVLWRDPERRRSMGVAGRARVETELTLDRQADEWVALYEEVKEHVPARSIQLAEIGLAWPPEAFVRRKLQGLAERGADVAVASFRSSRDRPEWLPGLTLERLPHWAEPRHRALLGMVQDAAALLLTKPGRLRSLARARAGSPEGSRGQRWRLLRLHLRLACVRADVAHFEWTSVASTCSPLFDVWDFPVAVSCHGSEVLVRPFTGPPADLGPLFQRVAAVHCVSAAVAEAAGAIREKPLTHVIPSAVDPHVFRPPAARPPDGEFVVVSVSALRWVKGYEYALAAIARLAEADVPVRYEIAGAEPRETHERGELSRLRAAVADLGLTDRVRLHGHLSEADVVRLLQCADAYLQASLSEGMPTAVLEAMACGLPVVATDVGGTGEILTDGVEGYLVSPRDARAAADALTMLWRDAECRRALGLAGRARVEKEFTLEQQLDRFESLYEGLTAS